MSSKYATQLEIPSDFPNVLRDLSREILRAVTYESIQGTEEEILAFASKHFKKMARQGRATRFNRRKIMNAAMELFASADEDGSGDLDAYEVANVFRALGSDIGVTSNFQIEHMTNMIMKEADISGDGLLQYKEFLPVAVDIIESILEKYQKDAEKTVEDKNQAQEILNGVFEKRSVMKAARLQAEGTLVHGLGKDELEEMMYGIFTSADKNEKGYLTKIEIEKCMRAQDILSLSEDDLINLLNAVDKNGSDRIDFQSFVPLCYNVLVEQLARSIALEEDMKNDTVCNRKRAEKVLKSMGKDAIQENLLKMFRDADLDGNGVLDPQELISALEKMNIGLTTNDMKSILEFAMSITKDGMLPYVSLYLSLLSSKQRTDQQDISSDSTQNVKKQNKKITQIRRFRALGI